MTIAAIAILTGWDEEQIRGTKLSIIRALMRQQRIMNQTQGPPMQSGPNPRRRR
jgi:hypothetical protein